MISSESGVQQGDPAGPLFFCLAIKELCDTLMSQFKVWYLDDATIGGTIEDVISDIISIIKFAGTSGLELNTNKCEIFALNLDATRQAFVLNQVRTLLPGAGLTPPQDLEILGAPVLPEAISKALRAKVTKMNDVLRLLPLMNPQQALFLLRCSFLAPKFMHLLRTTPLTGHEDSLRDLEEKFRETLEKCLNLPLDERLWAKASLPICGGGLGIRSPLHLAGPCHVSSLFKCSSLVQELLPVQMYSGFSRLLAESAEELLQELDVIDPAAINWSDQKEIDKPFWINRLKELSENCDVVESARLLAAQERFAGRWLEALPSSQTGTLLDSNSFRVCVGLRLGV